MKFKKFLSSLVASLTVLSTLSGSISTKIYAEDKNPYAKMINDDNGDPAELRFIYTIWDIGCREKLRGCVGVSCNDNLKPKDLKKLKDVIDKKIVSNYLLMPSICDIPPEISENVTNFIFTSNDVNNILNQSDDKLKYGEIKKVLENEKNSNSLNELAEKARKEKIQELEEFNTIMVEATKMSNTLINKMQLLKQGSEKNATLDELLEILLGKEGKENVISAGLLRNRASAVLLGNGTSVGLLENGASTGLLENGALTGLLENGASAVLLGNGASVGLLGNGALTGLLGSEVLAELLGDVELSESLGYTALAGLLGSEELNKKLDELSNTKGIKNVTLADILINVESLKLLEGVISKESLENVMSKESLENAMSNEESKKAKTKKLLGNAILKESFRNAELAEELGNITLAKLLKNLSDIKSENGKKNVTKEELLKKLLFRTLEGNITPEELLEGMANVVDKLVLTEKDEEMEKALKKLAETLRTAATATSKEEKTKIMGSLLDAQTTPLSILNTKVTKLKTDVEEELKSEGLIIDDKSQEDSTSSVSKTVNKDKKSKEKPKEEKLKDDKLSLFARILKAIKEIFDKIKGWFTSSFNTIKKLFK